ncbi:hypothetical protein G6F24_015487 [Rhizopus arrhizus]|nr:hypothetical protein G6F24_015487 [Rhizopus arrhizus]
MVDRCRKDESRASRLVEPHRLRIDEFTDAEVRELAAEAALLPAAARPARVGRREAGDEHAAGLQPARQLHGARAVAGPQVAAEAELALVGQFHRVIGIARAADRRHWAEGLGG